MIIKITIVQPLMNALQASIGGSGILGLLELGSGTVAGAGAAATSTGAAGVGALGGLYHTGGIIGAEPTAMRYVHPAYFDDAPRFHSGGIAGDEVPIIARKGEGVFTPGQMAALGGGGAVTVNITNAPAGTSAQVSQTKTSNGTRIDIALKKMLDGAVGDSLSSGAGMRVLSRQFGIKQFTGQ